MSDYIKLTTKNGVTYVVDLDGEDLRVEISPPEKRSFIREHSIVASKHALFVTPASTRLMRPPLPRPPRA